MMDNQVKAVYDSFPPRVRKRLIKLRRLVLSTAASNPDIGDIEETLKWGEPAYLTSQSGSGTTLRFGWKSSDPDHYRMLVHCQTNLVDTFRTLYPELNYDGNRAVILDAGKDPPLAALAHCIEMTLTYHRSRR